MRQFRLILLLLTLSQSMPLITLPYMVAIKRQLCGQKLSQSAIQPAKFALNSCRCCSSSFLPWANVNFVILCKRQKSKGHKEARHGTARQDMENLMATARQDETRLDSTRRDAAIALPCNPAAALVTFVLSPSYERIANLNSSIIDQPD